LILFYWSEEIVFK